MLRELQNVQQSAGGAKRRWFFCHDLDLVVWEEDSGSISGFQLAYDKHRNEHSVSWRKDRGFTHYVVDDGEPMAGVNDTPFLYANGPFGRDRVLDLFLALAAGVPPDIVDFVAARLREFDGPLVP
ncbi:MAG: hypothetical protein JNK59_08775 [Sterolibacteriaceae bacterium]|uniref:hypothetical protein n=1 Tax=Sulfuritalea sp. TaxID=2480090 RepID=UPI001A484C31|nr:hypothetical protein [Sulfuritalea sp.]MBL8479390.1 hypothetical protein [Sterolibacteriaceae bacterium]MBN8477282.1 hypothetical protein [Sulfuritalea sp.]